MAILIHNSLTRKKDSFESLKPNRVGMYVCGPTVYDEPHIGHARSAYIFDVIRRYLRYRGYEVMFVRNVTDVDDKIIEKARKEYAGEDLNTAYKKVADKYLDAYHQALKVLGIASGRPEIIEPKASEYIPKMIEFIKNLIIKGAAYVSGGDVYFDITRAKDYGKLSHQSLDKMESGARVMPSENKRNPLDFALWKAAKVDEPSWDSPWGRGRPGWHIECSVMSSEILGTEFDIHGGGIDLIFPHHENEIAQSEGAGYGFARYWVHHGLLTINGQKMSKSLGNFVTIKDFLEKYKNADLLKLFFLSAHYAHPIDYNEEKIKESKKAYERFHILFQKIDKRYGLSGAIKLPRGSAEHIKPFIEGFDAAMDDDFNTPQALSVLFNMLGECNRMLDRDRDEDKPLLQYAMKTIIELGGVLGLSFKAITEDNPDTWVDTAVAEREQLRKEKKFKEADEYRKMLEAKGVILEDTKDGKTAWRRKL